MLQYSQLKYNVPVYILTHAHAPEYILTHIQVLNIPNFVSMHAKKIAMFYTPSLKKYFYYHVHPDKERAISMRRHFA